MAAEGADNKPTTITVETEFSTGPENVWKMITDNDTFVAWSGDTEGTGLSAEVGASHTLFGGFISGTVGEAVPSSKLVWKDWRAGFWPEGHVSTVTWELEPNTETGGTKVKLTHDQTILQDPAVPTKGWIENWFDPMQKYEELPEAKRQKTEETSDDPWKDKGTAPSHVDIKVTDIARAKKFYTDVFGWKYMEWKPEFCLFHAADEGTIGGALELVTVEEHAESGFKPGTIIYVSVPDIDAALEKIAAAGGATAMEKIEIAPGMGSTAFFTDSEGNYIGLYEPAAGSDDHKKVAEREVNGVCHVDIATTSADDAKTFYGGVFGWTFKEGMPNYMLFNVKGGKNSIEGGIPTFDAVPDGDKSPTVVYIEVPSIEEYVPKIEAAGGKLVKEKALVGEGIGYWAFFHDNAGNKLGLWEEWPKDGADGADGDATMTDAEECTGTAPCHVDIKVTNMDRAKKFYTDVFRWKYWEWKPEFCLFHGAGEGTIGGGLELVSEEEHAEAGYKSGTYVYICVTSIEEALKRVAAAGGATVMEKVEIAPGMGSTAFFTDSEGNYMGLYEPAADSDYAKKVSELELDAVCHVDIASKSVDDAKAFYGEVFNWKLSEGMPGYVMFDGKGGKKSIAGGIPIEAEVPPGDKTTAIIYINVPTIEEYGPKVEAAGGKLIKAKELVGEGIGYWAFYYDNSGNKIGLWEEWPNHAEAGKDKEFTAADGGAAGSSTDADGDAAMTDA